MAYSISEGGLSGVKRLRAAVVCLCLAFCGTPARAAEVEDQPRPSIEMWSGGEAYRQLWSVYGGAQWAPFGGLQEDGLRVRAVLGTADYGTGTAAFADVLLGYHKQLGAVTLKALGGVTVTDRHARDPQLALEGTDLGGKGVLEAWWTITDQAWASADVSWSSAQMDYGSRVRLGWRLWPELSAGLEGGSTGTWERDIARVGAFLRYEWIVGEVSISGGLAAEGSGTERGGPSGPFGTVSLLTRF